MVNISSLTFEVDLDVMEFDIFHTGVLKMFLSEVHDNKDFSNKSYEIYLIIAESVQNSFTCPYSIVQLAHQRAFCEFFVNDTFNFW